MALRTPQSVVTTGTTPSAYTPALSDTIAGATAGPNGWFIRVITSGTATNVSVLDPGFTPSSNPGTVTPVAAPSTGIRMVLVPKSAIDTTGVATVNFSSITGVTCELYTA